MPAEMIGKASIGELGLLNMSGLLNLMQS